MSNPEGCSAALHFNKTNMKKFQKILLVFVGLLAVALTVQFAYATGVTADAVTTAAFGALLYQQGRNNMGGYSNWAAVIPLEYISAAPALPSTPADYEDYVIAAGQFTFKNIGSGNTKYEPIFIYSTEEKVTFQAESVGEIDGKSYRQHGEFFYPGNDEDVAGFSAFIKNRPCIVIIADPDGKQQMIGTPALPCHISPSMEGGGARADLRGHKFEFSAPSNQPAVFLGTPFTVNETAGTLTYPAGN